MLTGYRLILFVLAGCSATAGASAPKASQVDVDKQRENYTQAAAKTIAAAISNTVQTAEKDTGCEAGKENRSSELCAQWVAADAARESAKYALFTLIISVAGTIAVVFTLHYTRKAVLAAEGATQDAEKALGIATRNANAAMRQVEVLRCVPKLRLAA